MSFLHQWIVSIFALCATISLVNGRLFEQDGSDLPAETPVWRADGARSMLDFLISQLSKSELRVGEKRTNIKGPFRASPEYQEDEIYLNTAERKRGNLNRPLTFGNYIKQSPIQSRRQNSGANAEGSTGTECPLAEDGVRLFPCPTPASNGEFTCIDDHALCDNVVHCPNREDEDKTVCMFHTLTMRYFRSVIDTMLELSHPI